MNVTKNLCGFSLADFPTFPIYYITFMAGQVGRHPSGFPLGGPLGNFKEPTFPIYNITFMIGKEGHPSRFS